jgi:hypothetical protein
MSGLLLLGLCDGICYWNKMISCFALSSMRVEFWVAAKNNAERYLGFMQSSDQGSHHST